MSRIFYLLAGLNGAGKSSLYKAACAEGLIPLTKISSTPIIITSEKLQIS
jgi:predicted ABC-type ATPase